MKPTRQKKITEEPLDVPQRERERAKREGAFLMRAPREQVGVQRRLTKAEETPSLLYIL